MTGRSLYYETYDYLTIKYNASGIQQWIARFNGIVGYDAYHDYATSIKVDQSGNAYVTGGAYSLDSRLSYNIVTLKYNESGIQQWFDPRRSLRSSTPPKRMFLIGRVPKKHGDSAGDKF